MPIFASELRHGWKALMGWIIGLIAVCVVLQHFLTDLYGWLWHRGESARDSLFQTFYRARDLYNASNAMAAYPIVEPPRPPTRHSWWSATPISTRVSTSARRTRR